MTVYVSIISHGHEDLLLETKLVNELSQEVVVVIKNNRESSKGKLNKLKVNDNVIVLDDGDYNLGFGHNNNYVFDYIMKNFHFHDDDFFCVVNPDVIIDCFTLLGVIKKMKECGFRLCTIPLYLNKEKTKIDDSIRNFPRLGDFFKSFFFGFRDNVKVERISDVSFYADWAAGSFLIFNFSLFQSLKGFDQRYFMYCEDIDVCYRSYLLGTRLVCLEEYNAIHLARRDSRSIFSKNFLWHLKSVFVFLFLKNKKAKSII